MIAVIAGEGDLPKVIIKKLNKKKNKILLDKFKKKKNH